MCNCKDWQNSNIQSKRSLARNVSNLSVCWLFISRYFRKRFQYNKIHVLSNMQSDLRKFNHPNVCVNTCFSKKKIFFLQRHLQFLYVANKVSIVEVVEALTKEAVSSPKNWHQYDQYTFVRKQNIKIIKYLSLVSQSA